MTLPILSISNLSKTFRSHWTFSATAALSNLSLDIAQGEAFGFLGHNGAGKTTTIKCILGLISKTSGKVLLEGRELVSPSQLSSVGYLPELPYFYDHLTVYETLEFFANLHGIRGRERAERIEEILQRVGLEQRVKSSVRSLSKGLQQRLAFAQAILNRPKLLILDEPFSGLDPLGRHEMKELLLALRNEGTTLLMSSHVLGDVEEICNRVSIMSRGKLDAVFSISDIATLFGERYELILVETPETVEQIAELARTADDCSQTHISEKLCWRIHYSDKAAAAKSLQSATANGFEVYSYSRNCPKLEEIFIKLTEKSREARPSVAAVNSAELGSGGNSQ